MPYTRDAEIYGENEPADYVYGVISGAVRTYKILGDGRRQIGAFYLPGDIFGLEADDEHSFSAEAISDAKILVIKRSALLALAERESEVARQLWSVTSQELRRVQDHILLLIKTAKERVGSFLLEMASAARAATISNFQCRDRTSPIISALRSKRFPATLQSLKIPHPSRSRARVISYCAIGEHLACLTANRMEIRRQGTVSAPSDTVPFAWGIFPTLKLSCLRG